MVIMSSASDDHKRNVIRNTWTFLSQQKKIPESFLGPKIFRHFFSIGVENLSENMLNSLEGEHRAFGDLLLLPNLVDTYSNLTRKTLLSIESIYRLYDFSFMLKVDSDSFVRVGALVKALKDIAHPRLYWGFLDGRAKPRRKGQWAERDWLLCDHYLPYQLGGGYVLAFKLVEFIAKNKELLKLYKNEDVSVGAWLAGLDLRYVHDPRFDTEFKSRGCNNEFIITHKQSPDALQDLYQSLVNSGKLCQSEYRSRGSYVYDWSVPPSLCCIRRNDTSVP
ncbi:unnamed protein product [Dracunculus medinensis]|uniref:Hexosyltransferase n=1 Tax=Dracunculus medinensis TaxID=318479 RepID=A0A3P7SDN2_DRAME|nr:unnamed protein product [Dracunculus medinensis]